MTRFSIYRNVGLFILFLLLIPLFSQAQDFEPSKYFGGVRGNLNYSKLSGINYDFDAYYGRELKGNLSVGLNLGYSRGFDARTLYQGEIPSGNLWGTNTYKVGVFGRYKVIQGKRLSLAFEGNLAYERATNNLIDNEFSAKTVAFELRPILTYQLNKRLSLTGSLGGFRGAYDHIYFDSTTAPQPAIQQFNLNSFKEFKLGLEFKF